MNRLGAEPSPYLRQHADNPVDWHPWGPEAFAAARERDVPILLSIGYAACHWCHVMAHESFEDPVTAELMNRLFVNVKVDREERPDVDSVYMQAVQAMTGHGGWPMTMFLTPDGTPFHGGTYFPPQDRHGLPSFRRVLEAVDDAWRHRRAQVLAGAAEVLGIYDAATRPPTVTESLSVALLDRATLGIATRFDHRAGGFGGAPKFPPTMVLDFLLRRWARRGDAAALAMVQRTWQAMADGGIHDQVGGGFARYAVDDRWLVPHFEKMLYDNALLVRLGAHLWQATRDPAVREVTERTLRWLQREMTDPAGGFHASLDADSEGEEGRFYTWERGELERLLGDDAAVVLPHWGVTAGGNFEGRNILHVARPIVDVARECGVGEEEARAAVARARRAVEAHRARRIPPARDDKVLAGWNGLMLRGVATAARAFDDARWLALAVRNAEFCATSLVREGRAWRSWAGGRARIPGVLEDHAALALGFLALYEATFDRRWLAQAEELAASCVTWFWDDALGGFWDTAHDAEPLVTRPRDVTDNALPSGSSLATELCLHLATLTGDAAMRERGDRALAALAAPMARAPLAFGHLLGVADLAVHGAVEVALAGDPGSPAFERLARAVGTAYVPSLVLAGGTADRVGGLALMEGRWAAHGAATAFVCRGYACEAPTHDPAELHQQLDAARAQGHAAGG